MSRWFTEVAAILMTASVGVGMGSGRSTIMTLSDPPCSWTRIAFTLAYEDGPAVYVKDLSGDVVRKP